MKKSWVAGGILMAYAGVHQGVAFGQLSAWEAWELSGVVWCGDPEVWSVDSTSAALPIHRLNASTAGTQILWGCPTSPPAEGDMSWRAWTFWEQDLNGSNANQSAVLWAAPPDSSATTSVEILALSHQAGWLDETGGFAAGTNGSTDPLTTHAPMMAEWEVAEGCHEWSEPFAFTGYWTWHYDGLWKVRSWDNNGRSQTWVDTLTTLDIHRLPCLGIEVKHTSSNGDRWAFGWVPSDPSLDTLSPTDLATKTIELIAPDVLEGVLQHQSTEANLEMDATLSCDGDGEVLFALLPDSTLCENAWLWQLPCSLSAGQSVAIGWDELLDTLWRDGSAHLTSGDLAFTEIMADPTPALYAPESTYLEVFNASSLAIDPTALRLVDSGDTLNLEWVETGAGDLVVPDGHFIIADAAGPWADWFGGAVVRAVGWSGLRDAGEALELLGPDLNVIEELSFLDAWWRDVPQDGQSLSCASPPSCDDPANWQPDPLGASPGRQANLGLLFAANQSELSLRRTPDDILTVQSNVPWDPRHEVVLHLTSATGTMSSPLAHGWDDEGFSTWKCPLSEGVDGPFQLTIHSPPSCQSGQALADIDTLWDGHRPPKPEDILLTEILSSAHPILQSEFVEWFNASGDTLGWKGSPWVPGACLIQATHTQAHVQTWMGPSWFETNQDMIWEVLPNLSLTNDNGKVTLEDEWGNLLASVDYSQCGHSSANGASEGRSMECLPFRFNSAVSEPSSRQPAWRTAPDDRGMSPGQAGVWEALGEDALSANQASWGVFEGAWIMTVPGHAQAECWAKERWEPATEWTPFWHNGVLMMKADHGPAISAMGPVNMHDSELSFPQLSWQDHASSEAPPQWNEVLLEPMDGDVSFLEWQTYDVTLWSGQWHWSSQPNPDPQDFVSVSDIDWMLAPHSYPCFASCPNWVDEHGLSCLSANVPSLYGDRVLTMQSQDHSARIDLSVVESSAWVLEEEGRSMARIPGTGIWTSTPPPMRATPGKQNGPAHIMPTKDGTNTRLLCSQSIRPGGDDLWDVATMTWSPPGGNDLYELNYGVVDPMRSVPLQSFEAMWSSAPLQWDWKGTDEHNLLVNPGPYLAVVEWVEHSTGRRGVDRCMVAVAPGQ